MQKKLRYSSAVARDKIGMWDSQLMSEKGNYFVSLTSLLATVMEIIERKTCWETREWTDGMKSDLESHVNKLEQCKF